MDTDFGQFVSYLWQHKPILIVLFVAGLILFVLLVIDTHRHRKHRKRRFPIRHFTKH